MVLVVKRGGECSTGGRKGKRRYSVSKMPQMTKNSLDVGAGGGVSQGRTKEEGGKVFRLAKEGVVCSQLVFCWEKPTGNSGGVKAAGLFRAASRKGSWSTGVVLVNGRGRSHYLLKQGEGVESGSAEGGRKKQGYSDTCARKIGKEKSLFRLTGRGPFFLWNSISNGHEVGTGA